MNFRRHGNSGTTFRGARFGHAAIVGVVLGSGAAHAGLAAAMEPAPAPMLVIRGEPAAGGEAGGDVGPFGRIEIGGVALVGGAGNPGAASLPADAGNPQTRALYGPNAIDGLLRVEAFPLLQIAPDPQPLNEPAAVSFFTPRWQGLQIGASFAQDGKTSDGKRGAEALAIDNALALSVNYRERFGEVAFDVTGIYRGGDEGADTAPLDIWGLGGKVAYRGFELGGKYVDQGRSGVSRPLAASGADAGYWWDIGLGYAIGQWQVSAAYLQGNARNGATEPEGQIDMFSIAGGYTPAAGWNLRANLSYVEIQNGKGAGTTPNTTSAVVTFSSILKF